MVTSWSTMISYFGGEEVCGSEAETSSKTVRTQGSGLGMRAKLYRRPRFEPSSAGCSRSSQRTQRECIREISIGMGIQTARRQTAPLLDAASDGDRDRKTALRRRFCRELKVGLSVAVKQHAILFLFAHRAIEELVAFKEDLDECRAGGDCALNHRLRQRVFDVAL